MTGHSELQTNAVPIPGEQRSAAWFAARACRVTGSVVDQVFARGKAGVEATGRRDLRIRLALERICGLPLDDGYESADMRRGRELESDARAAYEAATGQIVDQIGFLSFTDLLVGCSPDGLVGDGLVEFKCPKSATHLGYLRVGTVPPAYVPQCLHALWITGAAWCDFVSYDPRFPPALQLLIVRLVRDEAAITTHEAAVRAFLAEVDREVAEVQRLAQVATATTRRHDHSFGATKVVL